MDTNQPIDMDVDMGPEKSPKSTSQKNPEQSNPLIGKRRRVSTDPNYDVYNGFRDDAISGAVKQSEEENESGFQPRSKRVCRRVSCEIDEMAASTTATTTKRATETLPQQQLPSTMVARLSPVGEEPQRQSNTRTSARTMRLSDDFDGVTFNLTRPARLDLLPTQPHQYVAGSWKPRLITPSSSFVICVPDSPTNEFGNGIKSENKTTNDEKKEARTAAPTAHDTPVKALPGVLPTQINDPIQRKPQAKRQRAWLTILTVILPLLVLIEVNLLIAERVFDLPFDPAFSLHGDPVEPDSVYVPGAGFSGFWFTLGRLRSIPEPASKAYYCYSAGCLGVVATLSDRNREEMYELASDAQRLWQDGEIGLYDVVPKFVDDLLSLDPDADEGEGDTMVKASNTTNKLPVMADANLLSRINIITTRKEGRLGMKHAIRTPKTIQELREGLIHTTWIPFATGESLWAQDTLTGDHYMDGAFSSILHPICTYHLGLPFMLDLFMNTLNVNLGKDKVEKYWDAGVAFGSGVLLVWIG